MISSIFALVPLLAVAFAKCQVHDDTFTPDYVLEATLDDIKVNCHTRSSVVFNGTYPGPTLYLKEEQTTWIRVYNRVPDNNVTVHWHGLSQRAAPFSDGTPLVSQWPIPANHFFDYEIRPNYGDAGTYFYHSHVGFQSLTAHGALIVKDAKEPPYEYDDDITLIVGDNYAAEDEKIEEGLLADPFTWSGEPQAITLQGNTGNKSFNAAPDLTCTPHVIEVDPGKTYRLRFISATALSLIKLGIEDHDKFTVIEADGSYTKRAEVDHVQVSSGQRFSYLFTTKDSEDVCGDKNSQFWVRYESRDRPAQINGYALLKYRCPKAPKLPKSLPKSPPVVLPNKTYDYLEYKLEGLSKDENKKFPSLSEVTRTVTIQVNQILTTGIYENGTLNGTVAWAQNGLPWKESVQAEHNQVPYLIQVYENGRTPNYSLALEHGGFDPETKAFPAKVGEVLDIVWENNNGPTGGWDFHPMHIHGQHFWDLGGGNGTYNARKNEKHFKHFTPVQRDTTNLYRYAVKGVPHHTAGWRAWRIRVTEENVGAWMMHCHVLQHQVMGMATVWVFGDAAAIRSKFPAAPYSQGYLEYGGSAYGSEKYPPSVNHYYTKDD
ncbi:Multicopper oxidase aurL2 [Fusarium torreyae]|uniref:Multicopper oxidase aurL2 n=1 Tax=Fusarium torreyae TaxID=1237075 RepID=A0A9W8S0E0_9HYPO|nr:Multicopper oxidase aurL2 [Fusarium torreyae]